MVTDDFAALTALLAGLSRDDGPRREAIETARRYAEARVDAPLTPAEIYDSRAAWSLRTFGPGDRYTGVVAHIRRELVEIERDPSSVEEWVDVVMLAMDGAWRSAGADGATFWRAFAAKASKNEARKWAPPDAEGVVEHVREAPLHGVVPFDVPQPTEEPCAVCGNAVGHKALAPCGLSELARSEGNG